MDTDEATPLSKVKKAHSLTHGEDEDGDESTWQADDQNEDYDASFKSDKNENPLTRSYNDEEADSSDDQDESEDELKIVKVSDPKDLLNEIDTMFKKINTTLAKEA